MAQRLSTSVSSVDNRYRRGLKKLGEKKLKIFMSLKDKKEKIQHKK